jgi:CheY-like chemotaxis protein
MNQNTKATVQFVGRREEDARQLGWLLSNATKPDFAFVHVPNFKEIDDSAPVEGDWVIVLDVDENPGEQFEVMAAIHQKLPDIPIVVLTGDDEEVGREAIRLGAQDFLVKGQLTTEGSTPFKDTVGIVKTARLRRCWNRRQPF